MRAHQQNNRLLDREAQSRGWAAPLPDFTAMPRAADAPRMRLEWDTRDTMNTRLWSDMITSGPKAVTTAMLTSHPSHGAETQHPTTSRTDERHYSPAGLIPYYPDAPPLHRPKLPPHSLFQNSWMEGFNMESRDTVRELRAAVKEENRFRVEETSSRIMGRTFEHQWLPPTATQHIVTSQLDAAERLRPTYDDYRTTFRN
jgi:hypothetical protein